MPEPGPVEHWTGHLQAEANRAVEAAEEAQDRLGRFVDRAWSDHLAVRRQAAEEAARMWGALPLAHEPGWPYPWTRADAAAASAEGWDLFDSSGSANGPWQVQSFDDQDDGITDDVAMRLVRDGAAADPTGMHARVLAILAVANPLEHRAILDVDTNDQVTQR